jgi:tRNA(adenine34) deaminase
VFTPAVESLVLSDRLGASDGVTLTVDEEPVSARLSGLHLRHWLDYRHAEHGRRRLLFHAAYTQGLESMFRGLKHAAGVEVAGYGSLVAEPDERFMHEALALARRGLERDEMPIGAVVVLDGVVIGSSYWRYVPGGLLEHAEMSALRAAAKDPRVQRGRRRATLYTTLEPCLMCMGASMSLGVARVVFALEARFDGASTVTKDWQPQLGFPRAGYEVFSNPEVVAGVGRDGSLDLMRAYVDAHPESEWLRVMLPDFSIQPLRLPSGLTALWLPRETTRRITRRSQVQILPPLLPKAPETVPLASLEVLGTQRTFAQFLPVRGRLIGVGDVS